MNKNIIIGLLAIAALVGAFTLAQKQGTTKNVADDISHKAESAENTAKPVEDKPANADDKVVARYNGGTIYKSEVNEKLKTLFGGNMPEGKSDFDQFDQQFKENFLRGLVAGKVILGEAVKNNLERDPKVEKQVAELKEQVIQNEFIGRKVKELVTEDTIKQRYDQFAKEAGEKEEVQARHILVGSEKEAKDIEEELKKGASFEELAKKHSKDESKDKGGELGYFSRGQMVKPFEDAAFALKVGEVSQPVKSDFGWHIIKLENRRKATVPPYAEVKPRLQSELEKKAADDYVQKLLQDAKLELQIGAVPAAKPEEGKAGATPAPAATPATPDSNAGQTPAPAAETAPATTPAPAAGTPATAPATGDAPASSTESAPATGTTAPANGQ